MDKWVLRLIMSLRTLRRVVDRIGIIGLCQFLRTMPMFWPQVQTSGIQQNLKETICRHQKWLRVGGEERFGDESFVMFPKDFEPIPGLWDYFSLELSCFPCFFELMFRPSGFPGNVKVVCEYFYDISHLHSSLTSLRNVRFFERQECAVCFQKNRPTPVKIIYRARHTPRVPPWAGRSSFWIRWTLFPLHLSEART